MFEKVEYIQSIFKISADNSYVVTDIAEELAKVDSFDDLRKWLKINLNHIDAQFMNPFQKFMFLINKYQKHRLEYDNKERISKSRTFAKHFSNKVKEVSHLVEEKEIPAHVIRLQGKQFFTDYEISQINKLGGLYACVRLQRSQSGNDALAEKISDMAYKMMVSNIIEYKPREKTDNNIAEIVSNVVRKI